MAECIASSALKNKPGGRRSKKLSTRVDLTPMVDLGFLLITFFIFTTTMSLPKTLAWVLPKDSQHPVKQKESAAITLIPSDKDQLYYYEGVDPTQLHLASFNALREIIHHKQMQTSPNDFMVVIKPTAGCSYKNTVAVFDEMTINQVKKYALVDLSPEELKSIIQIRP